MAKANFVNKARKNIYVNGKVVKYVSQKGKRKGQTLEKLDRTQPENKQDKIFIKKGESYWHWTFMGGITHISKERPKQSQLTQSEFLSSVYQIEEAMQEASSITEDEVQEWISELESILDEVQDRLSSMPEQLQESSSSGQLLQERIDNLEQWIESLQSVDFNEINEEEAEADAKSEWDTMEEKEKEELVKEEWIAIRKQEILDEKQSDIDSEIQSSSPGF